MTDYEENFGQKERFLIKEFGSKIQTLVPSFNYPLTQTDQMSDFCVIPQYIKIYGHFYLMNYEV